MKILLNGKPQEVDDNINLIKLIEVLGVTKRRMAIEVNKEVIPRSNYLNYYLRPNDCIEIVHAIGGG